MADIEVAEVPVEAPEAPEAAPAVPFDDSYDEALLIKVKGKVRGQEPMAEGRASTLSSRLTHPGAAGEASKQAR
jgi:hypothetical protein